VQPCARVGSVFEQRPHGGEQRARFVGIQRQCNRVSQRDVLAADMPVHRGE
jgi:hypothetical protein